MPSSLRVRALAVATSLILCALPADAWGQAFASVANGFGIEVGAGTNELAWTRMVDTVEVSSDLDEMFVTPVVRVHYNKQFYSSLHVMPFVGYNQFGGRSRVLTWPTDNTVTYRDQYRFHAIEVGSFLGYRWPAVQVNAGAKLSQAVDVSRTVEYEGSAPVGGPPEGTSDADDLFSSSSFSWGLRLEVEPVNGLLIGAEGWFGISNLAGDAISDDDIDQQHLRLLLGWRF